MCPAQLNSLLQTARQPNHRATTTIIATPVGFGEVTQAVWGLTAMCCSKQCRTESSSAGSHQAAAAANDLLQAPARVPPLEPGGGPTTLRAAPPTTPTATPDPTDFNSVTQISHPNCQCCTARAAAAPQAVIPLANNKRTQHAGA